MDGFRRAWENRCAVIRRRDLPQLDPARLNLPPRPKVVEIRTDSYVNALGDEGLEVLVVVEELSKTQLRDFSWEGPFRAAIRSALHELGEERFPLILFVTRAEDSERFDPEAGA